MTSLAAINLVSYHASARFAALPYAERVELLAAFRILLATAEYEQAALVHHRLTQAEDAKTRAEAAQMTLSEMLVPQEAAKAAA